MKILFLFPHFLSYGGASNVVLKFAKELQYRGHEIDILCANASNDFLQENAGIKITQLKIPNSNSILYWLFLPYWQYKINNKLDDFPSHILFPHILPSNWWAWIYKYFHKDKKIAWYCHEPSAFIHSMDWINAIPNPFLLFLAKILNPILKKIDITLEKKDDIVICNSQFTWSEYCKFYRKSSCYVVYPPIEFRIIPKQIKKEEYIFTVSKLSKFKNVDQLINAFYEIKKSHPEYELRIAGEGEESDNLKDLAASLSIQDSVKFLGKVNNDNLGELYKNSKATILCSSQEPFGLVLVESMMFGTPVIASNNGGPCEIIQQNETGFLYKDKNELIEFINEIISMNQEQYSFMQTKCQETARKFDLSQSISSLENILKSLM